jgi:hypothetical protein
MSAASSGGAALLVPGSTVPRHMPAAAAPLEEEGEATAAALPTGAPPTGTAEQHAWGPAAAGDFPVRAAHYRKLGKKEPSVVDLYELLAFDLVQTPRGP